MVFELTDSLINESVLENKAHRDSLHNLFLGFEEGNLLLSLSPELMDFLEKGLEDSLSRRVINYMQHHVLAHYNVLWQTRVVLDEPDLSNHELSIDYFRNSSAIQPPTLLCENLNDAQFYFQLCEEYFGISYINTKNRLGGGGSSVADNLEQFVKSADRFCLCIVDSDIKYPGCNDGGTYVAIQNKQLPIHSSYDVHKLTVHEIENLIPIDIIISLTKDKKVKKFARYLKLIDKGGDILSYYDIKEGVKLKSIVESSDYYSFAELIYNRLKKPSDKDFSVYLSTLSEIVFIPLYPNILDRFVNLDMRSHNKFVYCAYLENEWNRIKDIIVTFFCARSDEPIN